MLTTRLCDLVWEQASVRIPPCIGAPDATMASTSRMLEHHRRVEEHVAGRTGLIENVGKHWVLTNRLADRPDRAANYGWFDPGAAHRCGQHTLWQPLGLAHDPDHVDYSQVVRLVRRRCTVDDAERDLLEVMTDPALAGLLSSEGPCTSSGCPGCPKRRGSPRARKTGLTPRPKTHDRRAPDRRARGPQAASVTGSRTACRPPDSGGRRPRPSAPPRRGAADRPRSARAPPRRRSPRGSVRRFVPGIGTMKSPCASTHASASCDAFTPFSRGDALDLARRDRGSAGSSRPGIAARSRRKSSGARSSKRRICPVRKPRPRGL